MAVTPGQKIDSRPAHEGGSFHRLAHQAAEAVGSPVAFWICLAATIVWALSGPYFGYSDTWQLVINTATTVITFLVVFLIQNTQNRDAKVMQLKLDELLRAIHDARNAMVHLEDLSDEQIERLNQQFAEIHRRNENREREAPPETSPR